MSLALKRRWKQEGRRAFIVSIFAWHKLADNRVLSEGDNSMPVFEIDSGNVQDALLNRHEVLMRVAGEHSANSAGLFYHRSQLGVISGSVLTRLIVAGNKVSHLFVTEKKRAMSNDDDRPIVAYQHLFKPRDILSRVVLPPRKRKDGITPNAVHAGKLLLHIGIGIAEYLMIAIGIQAGNAELEEAPSVKFCNHLWRKLVAKIAGIKNYISLWRHRNELMPAGRIEVDMGVCDVGDREGWFS